MASADPTPSNSQISQRVSWKTVEQAVKSLLRWRNSKLRNEKPKLLGPEEEFVYLILTLKKIPTKDSVNPYKILLPHSLTSEFSENCLIIDDRSKSSLTKEDAQKKVKAEDIPIANVLKLSKLKSDYQAFEAKRKLCNSYNIFFADSRVIPLLPKLIGRKFFKKKIPLALDLTHKNWKEQIEKGCRSALLFLTTGTCSVVKVARTSMEKHEIVENVVAAIDGIVEVVPKKWKNIRSFHIKLLESVSLPIYESLPDYTLKIAGQKEKEDGLDLEEEEGKKASEDEIKGNKASKQKGRIHEVKDDDVVVDFKEKDNGVTHGETEDVERINNIMLKKTERDKVQVGAPSETIGLKRMKKSAKHKSEDGGRKKRDEISLIK